ncbi:hypothetical protein A2246_02680 [candidate division WOR-1 bacterium RIFOXYA2_FULL_37_7]|uniref:Pseudouridine synthase n=1 Tax=candidate division WOR-1 bacterium RIFOXYB2_FULL_37_13 TaxID=1802579 RepID=A0A1F4SMZ3_UNCSA|nr:MAG: hypothetical protein A2246_02680 [candidate division WOR-1 bacterium RIFOXYA2_FULL_37_7]OGC21769.1 MAG: hypothetical protein A2310_00485 [candidate division WOR-1 bacterium RIFOXYB2_FULL_37_13]
MPPDIRLQKYIAQCGISSRRKAEELILTGKVKVNGQTINKLGSRIDPEKDKISVNGKLLQKDTKKIYIKLYKPKDYISSCKKYPGEKNIFDLIKDVPYRLYPVGRLDKDSEGLMLLTNDGELANRLMHPKYQHEKEYEVVIEKYLPVKDIKKLETGIILDGKKTLPVKISIIGSKKINMILKEGKKRQIRRMLESIGNNVLQLKRTRIKKIKLDNLTPGTWEFINNPNLQ